MEGPVSLLTPVNEALFSSLNCLELFEIVRALHFGTVESWLAFRRSREITWSQCAIENQFYPYNWRTRIFYDHPSLIERVAEGMISR